MSNLHQSIEIALKTVHSVGRQDYTSVTRVRKEENVNLGRASECYRRKAKIQGGLQMLASSKVIGFVPTKDSAKARSFYEDKLGFQFVSEDIFALVMRAGETMIRIAKTKDFTPAQYTVLGWEVSDIEEMAAWLEKRGVAFEKYPWVQEKSGIW